MMGKSKGAEMKKLIAACAFLLCGVFSLTMLFCTILAIIFLGLAIFTEDGKENA